MTEFFAAATQTQPDVIKLFDHLHTIHHTQVSVCLFWIYGYFHEKRINSKCSMHFNGARDMIYLYVNWMRKEFERLLKNNSMNWICLVSILVVSPSKATAQLVLIIYDTLVGFFSFNFLITYILQSGGYCLR